MAVSVSVLILCYWDKLWHSEAEQLLCNVVAKHNLEWHLAYKNNGRNMCQNVQEARDMFRDWM
jgi:hypothetical protein